MGERGRPSARQCVCVWCMCLGVCGGNRVVDVSRGNPERWDGNSANSKVEQKDPLTNHT